MGGSGRRLGMLLLLLAAAGARAARGEEDAGTVPEAAAEAWLRAVDAGDEAALARLAQAEEPDPWRVAQALLAGPRADTAGEYARRVSEAHRPATARLEAYVAQARREGDDVEGRERLADMDAAARGGDAQGVQALASKGMPRDPLLRVLFLERRSWAEAVLGRLDRGAAAQRVAAAAAESLGWLRGAAEAYEDALALLWRRFDHRGARDVAERLVALRETLGRPEDLHRALGHLAAALGRTGAHARAADLAARAATIAHETGDRERELSHLVSLALQQSAAGDHAGALRSVRDRALPLAHGLQNEVRDADARVLTLRTLEARLDARRGRYPQALDLLQLVLREAEQDGYPEEGAAAWHALGDVQFEMGRYAAALGSLERARATARTGGKDRLGLAAIHRSLAGLTAQMGLSEEALRHVEEAVRLFTEAGRPDEAATALMSRGLALERTGDLGGAHAAYAEAHRILGSTGDRAEAAMALLARGEAEAALGRPTEGLGAAEGALAALEDLGEKARALKARLVVGLLRMRTGRTDEGMQDLDRVARDAERHRADETLARAITGLAEGRLRSGQAALALETARRALPYVEGLLTSPADMASARARGRFADLYSVGTRAAVQVGDVAAVAQFLEAGRAGALLEALQSYAWTRAASVPPELREAEERTKAEEAAAAAALSEALEQGDRSRRRDLRTALDAARSARETVGLEIQKAVRVSAPILQPRPATIEEMQESLAPGDALLLYALDEEGALALVIEPEAARIARLGDAAEIRTAVEALRAGDLLADPMPTATRLRSLLVEPLTLGPEVRRLLVSPDGVLAGVPFVLIGGDRDVVLLPSGTTYALLREETVAPGVEVLGLGDPAYRRTPGAPAPLLATRGARGIPSPLPATREEVLAVADVRLLGADATEAGLRAVLPTRRRWRAIHLACHGFPDDDHPLQSALALAPGPEDDGYLTALEVLGFDLSADAVVLSACETARGRVFRAEGTVGLARSFLIAGAPRVLSSLWKVDDEATRALMAKFYELWNGGRGGGDPGPRLGAAEALRRAQGHVRSQGKWGHPYYWAAWVLWGLP